MNDPKGLNVREADEISPENLEAAADFLDGLTECCHQPPENCDCLGPSVADSKKEK